MKKYILILISVLIWINGCKISNEISYTNLASVYDPASKLQITGLRIFNETDSISRVYLSYNSSSLKYLKPTGKSYFKASYGFTFQLFTSYESNEVLDEGTFQMTDSIFYSSPALMKFDFPVRAGYPGSYLLQLRFTDFNAGNSILFPVRIEKQSAVDPQNFIPVNDTGDVILRDWVSWKTKFRIRYNNPEITELKVDYFNRDFPAAAPPFSQSRPDVYEYRPDESFTVKMERGLSEPMQYAREGFFCYHISEEDKTGLTIYRFHDYFPNVSRPEQMIPPLRYLTSNKEFETLINADFPKQAVDSFWVATAGNEERATALIRKYYGRVEHANQYFSSFKEGWKTDRGMIYIIFGEPSIVYRRTDIETWIYGEQGNRVFLTFDFIRAVNPFTENDYELQRNSDFKQQWYNAVLFWRQ